MPTLTICDGPVTWFRYELTEKSHLSAITRAITAFENAGNAVRYFTRNVDGIMVVFSDKEL